ncbi:phospholipase A2 [Streptomyces zhihengii]|uniref:phospholipase A2 n=1 Tax=Streptomyces zhihengii TaxID=1818004 RepID=UPI0036A98D48
MAGITLSPSAATGNLPNPASSAILSTSTLAAEGPAESVDASPSRPAVAPPEPITAQGDAQAAAARVGSIVASGSAVYALAQDHSAVYAWASTRDTGTWTKIGGPAKALYAGDAGLFATNPDTGNLHHYSGTPEQWTEIGGPGADFAVGNGHVYALAPDHSALHEWTGQGTEWTKIGGPAKALYAGDAGLLATNPDTGNLHHYSGTPEQWTEIGGPGADFAVGNGHVYALAPDHSALHEWTGQGTEWTKIGGPAKALYAGDAGLLATNPDTGNLHHYSGTPEQWTEIGGPGADFALTQNGLVFGVSPDGAAVSWYRGMDKTWTVTGPLSATTLTPHAKRQRLDALTQPDLTSWQEFAKARMAHEQGQADPYGFDWSHNGCDVVGDRFKQVIGFNFRPACIRHDFGYRNYKQILGKEDFNHGIPGQAGERPKGRVDEAFHQDLKRECNRPIRNGRFTQARTVAEVYACERLAEEMWAAVAGTS